MVRLGAWICIALLTMYLVFSGGAWSGLYGASLRLASMIMVMAVLAAWGAVTIRRPDWRPRSVLLPAIIAAVAALAISTATSRFPRQSVEYLGYAIVLAALYLLLVRLLANPFFRARMGPLALGLALVLGGAYAGANLAHWITWWGLVGHLAIPPLRPEFESLTLGNPSAVFTAVVLFSCSATAFVGWSSLSRRVVLCVLMILAAFTILVSGSRAGWLAIAIDILGMGAIAAADGSRRAQVRAIVAGWVSGSRSRVVLAVGALGSAAILIVLAPAIIRRASEGGAALRLDYVRAAQRMFSESPLVGTGPGTWVIQRIRYTIAPETDFYIPHAHNIYAQTAAELGLVGLAAGLFLVTCLAILVGRGLRDPDDVRRRWGWAAAFGLIYFAAHQLLDFYANMPAILFAAALPAAWLDATAREGAPAGEAAPAHDSPLVIAHGRRVSPAWGVSTQLPGPAAIAAAVLVAVACIGLIVTELPATTEAAAVDLANAGEWGAADAKAQDAVATDPDWAPYEMTMGLTASRFDHPRAATAFRKVAETTDLPEAWVDLAAEELTLGNRSLASEALHHATRLGLQRTAIAMAVGDLANRLGEPNLALEAFTTAVVQVPSLASDPWWLADPTRKQQFPHVIDAAIAATSDWQIALMAGDPARARGLLPVASYATGTLVPDDIIAAWTGDDAALGRILAVCKANPQDGAALGWAARLEERRGDGAAADRYRLWAFEAFTDSVVWELRVSPAALLGREAAGGVAEFWGAYSYRRPTPWNLLVSSVVQVTLR